MQTIAREFNLSETVFVLKPQSGAHRPPAHLHAGAELPFAGHPTVGTAVLLAELRGVQVEGNGEALVVLEETIGAVRVGVRMRTGARRSRNSMRPSCPRRPARAAADGWPRRSG